MRTIINALIAITIVYLITWYSVSTKNTSRVVVNQVRASDIVASPSATPKEVSYPPVEEYLRLKFGVYADSAMLLLRGNGDGSPCSRGENHELDPKAVNDNTTWGGKGRDRGIFQISDYYHPEVSDSEAFDYKFNIDYAWRMFKNDNYTFKRWTCGRAFGI